MAAPSNRVRAIMAERAELERAAAENALRQKELLMQRNQRDVVTDKVTGNVYVKRHLTVTQTSFTLSQNTASTDSEIAVLASPGVPVGLEYGFRSMKANEYGDEYIVPRLYGAIAVASGTTITAGRLVIYVMSPAGPEKNGGRLLDIGIARFNGATAANRDTMLTYQVNSTFRAISGDLIRWMLNSGSQVSWTQSNFTMELIGLERQT